MKKVYIFPMRTPVGLKQKSPYIHHLTKYLLKRFNIVNYGSPSKIGILDILFKIGKADIFMFNWIENKRGIQGVVFIFILLMLKMANKKIVWTHHNVHPHKSNSYVSKSIIKVLESYADYIIIHTKESHNYLSDNVKGDVLYFFHPLFDEAFSDHDENRLSKKFDLLIWGNIRKSKGVDDFLKFMKENDLLDTYKIKVIGKFEKGYYNEFVNEFNHKNLDIEDKFVSADDLYELHLDSRFIFFPYNGSSVLNSGALITSIPKLIPIVGPQIGAFKELSEMNLILTYNRFNDIIDYLDNPRQVDIIKGRQKVIDFFSLYTWEKYSEFLDDNL